VGPRAQAPARAAPSLASGVYTLPYRTEIGVVRASRGGSSALPLAPYSSATGAGSSHTSATSEAAPSSNRLLTDHVSPNVQK
jgi:hypothetical protein